MEMLDLSNNINKSTTLIHDVCNRTRHGSSLDCQLIFCKSQTDHLKILSELRRHSGSRAHAGMYDKLHFQYHRIMESDWKLTSVNQHQVPSLTSFLDQCHSLGVAAPQTQENEKSVH